MKFNKYHILLPAVIIIWGLIGYQFFTFLNQSETSYYDAAPGNRKSAASTVERSYTLLGNYRDPFLRKKTRRINTGGGSVQSKRITASVNMRKPDVVVDWSSISYLGTIENNRSKTRIALISKQGKSVIVKEGEAIEGFIVVRIWKDSIKVECSKTYNVFRKKH
jgi:hypothetical protein